MYNTLSLLYTTLPSPEAAETVVRTLLDEKLIVCAHMNPMGTSWYMWEDASVASPECILWLKTHPKKLQEAFKRLSALHPYDVPCIVNLPPSTVNSTYAEWMREFLSISD